MAADRQEPAETKLSPSRLDIYAKSKFKYEDNIRENRPDLYKSFLQTRLLVGGCGVLLPIVLLGADGFIYGRRVRGSLSAYYYEKGWLHVWFVGSLWAIGVGLMVYMGTRKNSFASRMSTLAGILALVVALFPTDDQGKERSWVGVIHFVAAAIVIVSLGVMCIGFGWYDKHRTDYGGAAQMARKVRWLHYVAAGLIGIGIVLTVLAATGRFWPAHGIVAGEAIAISAFGASWFLKGAELWTAEMRNVQID